MIQITPSQLSVEIKATDTRLRAPEGAESDLFSKSLDQARENDRQESPDFMQTTPDVAALNVRELSGQVSVADRASAELSEAGDSEADGADDAGHQAAQRVRPRESVASAFGDRAVDGNDRSQGDSPTSDSSVEETHAGSTSSGGAMHDRQQSHDPGEKSRATQSSQVVNTPGVKTAPMGGITAHAQVPGANVAATSTKSDVVSSITSMSSFREAMSRVGAKTGSPQILRAETQVAAQASRIMVQGLREGKTEVVMRLKPEALGPVKIELSVDEGRVSAKMHAEHDAARELLKAGLDHLRCTLEARGLNVDRLEVVTPAEPGGLGLTSGGFDGADRHGASNGQEAADGNAGTGSGMDDGFATESRMVEPAAESAGMWWERGTDGLALLRLDAVV